MANIEQKIEELIQKKVAKLGYELYDIEYVKEGKEYYLRIYIDKPDGIDLEDCEKVSNGINEMIDTADLIDKQYFLEVSSPGIERKLTRDKHLKDNIGKNVEVKLFKSLQNTKRLEGVLKKYDTNNLKIEIENNEIEIDRKNISTIRLIYNWKEEE